MAKFNAQDDPFSDCQEAYTLDEAVEYARFFEDKLSVLDAHIALTGGCLLRGYSKKDYDFIVFSDKTSNPYALDQALAVLEEVGCGGLERRDHEAYGDGKVVYKCKFREKRVDFFFFT